MGLDKKRPSGIYITTSIYTDYWLVWLYLLTFEISCATAARWRSSVITLSLGMMLIEWRQVFRALGALTFSIHTYTSCHSYANALVTRSISLHDTCTYMQCKSSAWFQNRCELLCWLRHHSLEISQSILTKSAEFLARKFMFVLFVSLIRQIFEFHRKDKKSNKKATLHCMYYQFSEMCCKGVAIDSSTIVLKFVNFFMPSTLND